MQLERLEALGRAALENGGAIDKAEVDGIIALSRSLEKIGDIMRPEDAAKENQIAQDDQLADILQCINDRIVELAREFAQELRANEAGLARRAAWRQAQWVLSTRKKQYPLLDGQPATWLVIGGRGAGKTRLGAEWVQRAGARPAALRASSRATAASRWSARRWATCAR